MVTYWAFDGDAFSLLFQRPFTFWHTCFFYCSCCASSVLHNMRLYVGLWVPMCFGMANDWGWFFWWWILPLGLKKFGNFWIFLKHYIWLILILKTEFLFAKLLISKLKQKETLLKTVTIIRCGCWWCNARHKRRAKIMQISLQFKHYFTFICIKCTEKV
jgi:hypothetical protein